MGNGAVPFKFHGSTSVCKRYTATCISRVPWIYRDGCLNGTVPRFIGYHVRRQFFLWVLVLRGSSTFLYSKEDVTQGDPLSVFMYAIGTLPLIRLLRDPGWWTQLWYVDDASAGGTLPELRIWFNLLCSRGPSFGYHPESTKSFAVVNDQWKNEAADFW